MTTRYGDWFCKTVPEHTPDAVCTLLEQAWNAAIEAAATEVQDMDDGAQAKHYTRTIRALRYPPNVKGQAEVLLRKG
jgi:hypothetical protein